MLWRAAVGLDVVAACSVPESMPWRHCKADLAAGVPQKPMLLVMLAAGKGQ